MIRFSCPECNSILEFLGLTPNQVYEIFECTKCKIEFHHSRKAYLGLKEDYSEGWYIRGTGNDNCIRHNDEMPKIVVWSVS